MRFPKWQNGAGIRGYVYGSGSDPLAETNGSGAITAEYVYLNGKRIARIDADGSVHYYLSDALKSTSMVINAATGNVEEESDFRPYGFEVTVTGPGPNHYKFTGKERDAETGLDYFGARYYGSIMGRFMSPDPGRFHLGNPQSWNRYVFALNNPLRFVDPDGREAVDLAVFWLTVWVPTGNAFVPGDLLAAPSEPTTVGAPPESAQTGTPRPHNSQINSTNNLAVADASDGPLCPPFCSYEYHPVSHAYRIVADLKTDLSDSSKSTVALAEVVVPNSGGIDDGYGVRAWSAGYLGPPPSFATTVFRKTLQKLNDKDLNAVVIALGKANNGFDEAIYRTWQAALDEQEKRRSRCLNEQEQHQNVNY